MSRFGFLYDGGGIKDEIDDWALAFVCFDEIGLA